MSRFEFSLGARHQAVAISFGVDANDWRAAVRAGIRALREEGLPAEPSPETPMEVRDLETGCRYHVTDLDQLHPSGIRRVAGRGGSAARRRSTEPLSDRITGDHGARISGQHPVAVVSGEYPSDPFLAASRRPGQLTRSDSETRVELRAVAPAGLSRRPLVRAPGLTRVKNGNRVPCGSRPPAHEYHPAVTPPEGRSGDVLAALEAAVVNTRAHVPCEQVCALLPSPDMTTLIVVSTAGGRPEAGTRARLVVEEPVAGRLLGRTQPMLVREPVWLHWFMGARLVDYREARSILWIPVVRSGAVCAVLMAINSTRPQGFSQGELAATRYLASTVTRHLDDSRPSR